MTKATAEDKEQVVDILISAFENYKEDNSINLVIKQDGKRIQRMKVLMGYLFEKAMLFGEVYLSQDKKGCILIIHSDKEKITLKTVLLDIELAFKCIGVKGLRGVIKRQRIAQRYYPKEKHIRPLILGVKQEVKGKITAARLISNLISLYADNNLPVIIDTVSEYNVRLYQKLGFRIIHKETTLGFPIYFMRMN